ncbi:hypothetical protein E1B28_008027 [Marasmius oreades]|uniref:Uncharacterized protein n=1 Tax=Marasmius oreades TaxID=181124 RepID=A0A9P7UU29_9AGAR|nr:uncharacterized protein E1B28_008027 [Marasmius oreades]KAG7094427.1 hypothetical protein E1B28_008027 [Marasmius oreades]
MNTATVFLDCDASTDPHVMVSIPPPPPNSPQDGEIHGANESRVMFWKNIPVPITPDNLANIIRDLRVHNGELESDRIALQQ